MGHIVRLQTGDKRSPTRQLLLSDGTSDGNIYLHLGGFSPGPGALNMQMSGQTIRADGQQRVASSRNNIQMSIVYDLRGDTYAELNYLQSQISQYQTEARLYHEHDIGEKVYVYYRWSTPAMDDIPIPTWGQLGYFFEVISIEATWPDNLHTGQLVSGNIESVTLDLVCQPYPEGLDQWAFDADGIPDDDSNVIMTKSLTGGEFDGNWTLCGWIEHRESDYYVFEVYKDDTNNTRIIWDESDSRFEQLTEKTSLTTTNGSTQSLSAGDLVHVCLVSNGASAAQEWYINGTAQTDGPNGADWGNVTFTLGSSTSSNPPPANTDKLDAWRLFDDALTAAEVLALYNDELPIKSQTRGNKLISPPVWFKTRSGDGVLENVDGVVSASAKDNWGVAGGIPGDVEAKVKVEIDPGSTTPDRVYYFGRQAVQSTFTPDGVLWLDYSGTSDSGNSSGDAYRNITTNGTIAFNTTLSAEPISNEFQFIGRFLADTGAVVSPYMQFGTAAGNTRITGDKVSFENLDDFYLVDFGRLYCDWSNLQSGGDVVAGITGRAYGDFPLDDIFTYYRMNTTGTRSSNISSSYNLTDNGTTPTRAGKIGNAADFNGSSQWLSNTSSDFDFAGSFAISGWCLLDVTSSLQAIVAKYLTTGNQRSYVFWYNNSTSRFEFVVSADGGSTNITTVQANNLGAPSTATWYFFVCTFNARTNTISIQINDNDVDTEYHPGGTFDSTANFTVGATSGGAQYLNGGVDALGIWDRVLTPDEITNLYNASSGLDLITTGNMSLDFVQMLPKPSFKVEAIEYGLSIAATDKIVVENRQAFMVDTSGNHEYSFSYEGDDLTLVPEYYNYLFMLNGELIREYDISASNTVSLYVTPRYLLVGG